MIRKHNSITIRNCLVIMGIFAIQIQSAIIPNPKLNYIGHGEEGFLELRPNGSLILRSTLENSSNALQQALLFKSILNAIRMVPSPIMGNTLNDLSVKIYGEGVEHKFPPFLESIIQRIQTYFSVYKYTDTSEPLRDKFKPIAAVNDSQYQEIDMELNGDNEVNKKQTVKPSGLTSTTTATNSTTSTTSAKPTKSTTLATTSLTTKPAITVTEPSFEENEFIEIKKKQTTKGKS